MMNERFDEIIYLFPLLGNKQNWYVHPTPEKLLIFHQNFKHPKSDLAGYAQIFSI